MKSSAHLRAQMLADADAIMIDRQQRERERVARVVSRRGSSAMPGGSTSSPASPCAMSPSATDQARGVRRRSPRHQGAPRW